MDFKKIIPYIVGVLVLLAVSIGFFPETFQGKVVYQPDWLQLTGHANEIKAFKKKTGENSLWTNQLFGGMPTYYIGEQYPSNLLQPLSTYVMRLGLSKPVGLFFLAMVSAFVLFLILGVNPWLSIVGALAMGLSTYNFVIYEAGHVAKLHAIAYFPLVAAGVLAAYRKKYILGAVIFGLGFGFEIMTSHIQMTYYLGLCLLVYVIIRFFFALKEGELASFLKASALLTIAGLLAVGANTSRLWSAYDYMKETIRGPAILQSDNAENNKAGLSKDYVFAWSHGIAETLTFIIPGAYGGASQESIDSNSAVYKDLKRKGAPASALKKAPLYWGALPMTSGPVYFGAIICFLFVFGLFVVKGELKWWLLISSLLLIFLSFGKNMMWLSDIFYYYFPMYNKFRAVSSMLVIPQLTFPLLGILGLTAVVNKTVDRKTALMGLYIALGVTGGLCLLMALIGGNLFDFAGPNDARYGQAGYSVKAFIADRQSLLRSDAFRSLILIVLSAGLLWAYITEKLKGKWASYILFGALGLMILFDLGGIGKRYLNSSNFVSQSRYDTNLKPRKVDQQILKDTDPNFRVLDLSINTFSSNKTTYHYKTIGGYNAVKLRRYNDLIERHIGKGNQNVMNMLNTKYVINQQQQPQQNPGALGNVWLVNNIQKVANANAEIDALSSFDPKTTAVIHQEFDNYLGGFGGSGQGTITMTEYKPNHLTYQSKSSSEELAVFSEVWYNPGKGKGWQAFIDGQEVEHIRANYVLRAIKIPAGEHKIEFKFHPKPYYMGEHISLVSSLLLIFGFFGYLAWEFMRMRKRKTIGDDLDDEDIKRVEKA